MRDVRFWQKRTCQPPCLVRTEGTAARLRLTTTNAFAARWLVPRLPQWRKAHSRLKLEIVSTDEVVSLENGEADISIRYVRSTPTDGPSFELTRDKFHVVAAPKLVGKSRKPLSPVELARFPLIEAGWRSNDVGSANLATVGSRRPKVSPARSGSFWPCQLELSRRASRHRSRCFGSGHRDLQRLAGGPRTCERGPCQANERDDAGLRLLRRAPGQSSEDGVDQGLRGLGHGNKIAVCSSGSGTSRHFTGSGIWSPAGNGGHQSLSSIHDGGGPSTGIGCAKVRFRCPRNGL